MKVSKSEITLDLECWVDELSPAQLSSYQRMAQEHNAIKSALKNALSVNEGRELFNGQIFQAYSFKGKVLQELKDASLPPKHTPSPVSPISPVSKGSNDSAIENRSVKMTRSGRKRLPNYAYLESSDEEDDIPLAKRMMLSNKGKANKDYKNAKSLKTEQTIRSTSSPAPTINFRPSEDTAVGGLAIVDDGKGSRDSLECKLQGKTFPSLVVVAKPALKVKDMSSTRTKLDSKVKLVLMLTPSKFAEWLIQEGLLKAEQCCCNHRNTELKLGVYSDASKFPYSGGYVWISECCPTRFVSVFNGSIFEGATNPPSSILKLIYHWACQTNIQNIVEWVNVSNVYVKSVYTWLRAICTLAVHQKCGKLGGMDKYVEVGIISFGSTSQDGQRRQLKVEVLGVLDYAEKTIRLRAVEPLIDSDRNYKKRFQVILEPLQLWVDKDSIVCIDLSVDKMTLHAMGFRNILQASSGDSNACHTNASVMDYLRRIVPRMFQNTLSLLSRQMIQQFLDELSWREQFGTYALQSFNNITAHIAEQTRLHTNETLIQRILHVATNPFNDWSALPPNSKELPPNVKPKRLKKPINEADYLNLGRTTIKHLRNEKHADTRPVEESRRMGNTSNMTTGGYVSTQIQISLVYGGNIQQQSAGGINAGGITIGVGQQRKMSVMEGEKYAKRPKDDREEDEGGLKGLEEMYYGTREGSASYYERFPGVNKTPAEMNIIGPKSSHTQALHVDCPACQVKENTFNSNDKLQLHILSHIDIHIGKEEKQKEEREGLEYQCVYCLEKFSDTETLKEHQLDHHPTESKGNGPSGLKSSSPSSSLSLLHQHQQQQLFRCLICHHRLNSLNLLAAHMQNKHGILELPYLCQACGYRTSSHYDIIQHFYVEHKFQNFLQCPFCLDIYHFSFDGKVCQENVSNFYAHIKLHVSLSEDPQLKCPRCILTFINKGILKQHAFHHHTSFMKQSQSIRRLLQSSVMVPPPKVKSHHREPLPYTQQTKLSTDFTIYIDQGARICLECNTEIINEYHLLGVKKCNKCNYQSSCERAMFQHSVSECFSELENQGPLTKDNGEELFCICGYSTDNGNAIARHLAICGYRSAYTSVEQAQDNTVKRNMLNMLGLVKRDGDVSQQEMPQNTPNVTVTVTDVVQNPPQETKNLQMYSPMPETIAQQSNPIVDTMAIDVGLKETSEIVPTVLYPTEGVDQNLNSIGEQAHHIAAPVIPLPMEQSQSHQVAANSMNVMSSMPVIHHHTPMHTFQPMSDNVVTTPGQYHLGYDGQVSGQVAVIPEHSLHAGNMGGMPLMGELNVPHSSNTPQYMTEMHTSMYGGMEATTQQQHYHQMMQPQQHQMQQQHQQLPQQHQHQMQQQQQHHQLQQHHLQLQPQLQQPHLQHQQ